MPPSSLLSHARRIRRSKKPTDQIEYGPWLGSMRSKSADQVPPEFIAESDADFPNRNYHYLPRTGGWKRRGGQLIKFEASVAAAVGLLPAKWGAKCRVLQEFKSSQITGGVPTLIGVATKETVVSDSDAVSVALQPSFITWRDSRTANQQAYVQKLDPTGVPQWTTNGVQCGNSTGTALGSADVYGLADGGCIVAFSDKRGGSQVDTYAQRFNSAGVPQWTTFGVVVCDASGGDKINPWICSDGTSDGCILTWTDGRGGIPSTSQPYAQRLNGSGVPQWTANGVQVGTTGNNYALGLHQILSDGESGCYVLWGSTLASVNRQMLQRLTSSGVVASGWPAGGLEVSSATAGSGKRRMCRVADGVMVFWSQQGARIYARKVLASGAFAWAAVDVNAGQAATVGNDVGCCTDGEGGGFAIWTRTSSPFGPFVRRVLSDGTLAWAILDILPSSTAADSYWVQATAGTGGVGCFGWIGKLAADADKEVYVARIDGSGAFVGGAAVAINTATGTIFDVRSSTDGGGGTILVWQDYRLGNYNIYAQRAGPTGVPQWTANGVIVCNANGEQDAQRIAFATAPGENEPPASVLDDGRFSQVYIRDQVNNVNYTLGSEYGTTHYPAPGSVQAYKIVPLWYDSGDGGITRGTSEFLRRFWAGGCRGLLKVANWWYCATTGTPWRWNGIFSPSTTGTGAANRVIPSGPLPPVHAGSLSVAAADIVEDSTAFVRPDADVALDGWTDAAAGTTTIYQSIDEVIVDDADYVQSPSNAALTTYEVGLGDLGFVPSVDDAITIRYRALRTTTVAGAPFLRVDLVETATVRASHTPTPLTTSFTDWSFTLTAAQIAAVTDWTALRLRLVHSAGTSSNRIRVSYATLTTTTGAATAGGWRGSDKYYFGVAGRFEDDSIHAFCLPRGPNDDLPNGYNLFTVNSSNLTASYKKVTRSNLPVLPYGYKSLVLLRSAKIDSSTQSTLQLVPEAMWIVDEVTNGVTTYEDYKADDDALTQDPDKLLIRRDHIMTPRSRYIFGGDSRACVSYGGLNPCAIQIAPVGHDTDYDLNLADTDTNAYTAADAMYMRLALTADNATATLTLNRSDGTTVTTTSIDCTALTIERLVDKINASTCTDLTTYPGGQWRAQWLPGVDLRAPCLTALCPHSRSLTSCVVLGQTITRLAGGLSKIAVGSLVSGAGVTLGAYIEKIDSDMKLTFSGTITPATITATFYVGLGDAPTVATANTGYQRVIAGSLPAFIFHNKTYLNQFPLDKSSVWMTVASPGAVRTAPNCFSAFNKFTPPINAGISMGGVAVDNGFVVPFANLRAAIWNRKNQGTGLDREYYIYVTNPTSGCKAWQSLCAGPRCALMWTAEGWIGQDLEDEVLLSEAIWLHRPTPTGDFTYEAPLSDAASSIDNDTGYLIGHVSRNALWVNYRVTGDTRPSKQVVYDFSSGTANTGLRCLVRENGQPWGWSVPHYRPVTAMCEARRDDGAHLYGWNDENAGSTGDGRIDELETTETDNGTAISAAITTALLKGGTMRISGQEITMEHATPAGATVKLDYHRVTLSDATHEMTPSASAAGLVSDLKPLVLEARSGADSVYIGCRQTAGSAQEVRKLTLKLLRLKRYRPAA